MPQLKEDTMMKCVNSWLFILLSFLAHPSYGANNKNPADYLVFVQIEVPNDAISVKPGENVEFDYGGCLDVYVNGNIDGRYFGNGTSHIRKLLLHGTNTILVETSIRYPFTIKVVQIVNQDYRHPEILGQKTFANPMSGRDALQFVVAEDFNWPIFENALPSKEDTQKAIRPIIEHIYNMLMISNVNEITTTLLEGYHYYSEPKTTSATMQMYTNMFRSVRFSPFDTNALVFVNGTNLVFVYSRRKGWADRNPLLLFSDADGSSGVSGVSFGRVRGRWIIW